jgi:fructose-1,6-bisphosphatase/inositol monophosphatase family enzyme
MEDETKELIRFAELLADAARSICLDALQAKQTVSLKPDDSMVTETDLAIESTYGWIVVFVSFTIIAMCASSYYITIVSLKSISAEFGDGTTAFVAGIPVYGTLIGLAREGNPFIGIIDHPASNDRWVGVADDTTWMNGNEVRTRTCEALESAFMTCSNPDFFDEAEFLQFCGIRNQVLYTQYGGSCYAYGVLASGRTDIGIDSKMDPVDV